MNLYPFNNMTTPPTTKAGQLGFEAGLAAQTADNQQRNNPFSPPGNQDWMDWDNGFDTGLIHDPKANSRAFDDGPAYPDESDDMNGPAYDPVEESEHPHN
jgi:hypothetical protein